MFGMVLTFYVLYKFYVAEIPLVDPGSEKIERKSAVYRKSCEAYKVRQQIVSTAS